MLRAWHGGFDQVLKRESLASFSLALVCLLLAQAFVFVRLPAFVEYPAVKAGMDYLWIATGLAGWLMIVMRRPYFSLFSAVVFILFILQSYTQLYRPSLAFGIPRLDYLFFDRVSSNYCFDLAKTYLSNFGVPFYVFSCAYFYNEDNQEKMLKWVQAAFLSVLIVNLLVIAVQGWFDLSFLANGSGSALSARRAPGLLEDSGASTVVTSSLIVLVFLYFIETAASLRPRLLWVLALVLAVWMGMATGGRVYLSLIAMGLAVYLFVKGLTAGKWQRRLALIALAGLGVAFYGYVKMRSDFFQGTASEVELFHGDSRLVKLLALLDPIRATHLSLFLKGIPEYWPTGAGIGGSHIVMGQYHDLYASKGLSVSGDAPLNFYAAMLLEAGIAGLLLMLLAGAGFFLFLKLYFKERRSIVVGIAPFVICLAASLLVGFQIVFRSPATLMAFAFVMVVVKPICESEIRWRGFDIHPLKIALGLAVSLLICIVTSFIHIPAVPEFFWAKQGRPQELVPMRPPIQAPEGFHWRPSGVPLALTDSKIELFVELPPEHYPLSIVVRVAEVPGHVTLFEDKVVIPHYDPKGPGKSLSYEFDSTIQKKCLANYKPSEYCQIEVFTQPGWSFDGKVLGFALRQHGTSKL